MSSDGVYLAIRGVQPTSIQYRNRPIVVVTICECVDTVYYTILIYGIFGSGFNLTNYINNAKLNVYRSGCKH